MRHGLWNGSHVNLTQGAGFWRQAKYFGDSRGISILALIVSIVAACAASYISYRQEILGEAGQRDLFWNNVMKSKDEQYQKELELGKTIGLLTNREFMGPLFGAHGKIDCNAIQKHIAAARRLGEEISEDSNEIKNSYLSAVLGNNLLGQSLGVRGWDRFARKAKKIGQYWTDLSIVGMHLDLMYGQDSIDCAAQRKAAITINNSDIASLQTDIRKLNMAYIASSSHTGPNDLAYFALEQTNMPESR